MNLPNFCPFCSKPLTTESHENSSIYYFWCSSCPSRGFHRFQFPWESACYYRIHLSHFEIMMEKDDLRVIMDQKEAEIYIFNPNHTPYHYPFVLLAKIAPLNSFEEILEILNNPNLIKTFQ